MLTTENNIAPRTSCSFDSNLIHGTFALNQLLNIQRIQEPRYVNLLESGEIFIHGGIKILIFSAPLAGILVSAYSMRIILMACGLLSAVGFILCSLSPNLVMFALALDFVVGKWMYQQLYV